MRTTTWKYGEFAIRLEIKDSPANPVFARIWITNAELYFDDVELESYACTHLAHKKFNCTASSDFIKHSWAQKKAAEIIEHFKPHKAALSV